jgi:membrane protein involved in colicin uptake
LRETIGDLNAELEAARTRAAALEAELSQERETAAAAAAAAAEQRKQEGERLEAELAHMRAELVARGEEAGSADAGAEAVEGERAERRRAEEEAKTAREERDEMMDKLKKLRKVCLLALAWVDSEVDGSLGLSTEWRPSPRCGGETKRSRPSVVPLRLVLTVDAARRSLRTTRSR